MVSGKESNLEEAELLALWKERMEMAKQIEENVKELRLSKESNIMGKVISEIKSLHRASRNLSRASIDDGNIRHLKDVVEVASAHYSPINGLLRSFVLVSSQDNRIFKHAVDIVTDDGAVWVKVISRTAKGVAMDWLTGSTRTVVQQATVYLEHASLFPHSFVPPRVIFHFVSGVPDLLAVKLSTMGVEVIGQRVSLDTLCFAPAELIDSLMEENEGNKEEEERSNNNGDNGQSFNDVEPADAVSSLDLSPSSLPPINLDVSTVFVLITNLTHQGGIDHRFDSSLLREQALAERGKKAREELMESIGGRPWVLCATAANAVNSIVSTVGGPSEKARWCEMEPCIRIVEDCPSERAALLEESAKVNDRSIKIFGTGDSLQIVTASANKHFVQSAFHQGVQFAVILHESRALSEQKELPLP